MTGTWLTKNSRITHDETFNIRVVEGYYNDLKSIIKFGRNPDVDAGTEDLWEQGGTWVPPTAARIHSIVSTSDNDGNAAGDDSGALSMRIFGLDADYLEIEEDVTLDGTAAFNTTKSYINIYRMSILTAGSNGNNVGNITATAAVDSTVTASIIANLGQTELGTYIIPANKTGYISSLHASCDGSGTALVSFSLFTKKLGGAFNLRYQFNLRPNGNSSDFIDFLYPLIIEEKSIVKMTCTSSAANTDISGSFQILLRDN